MLGAASHADAQVIKLPSDAEYMGALLDSSIPVGFYSSGRLHYGTLKADYQRDGMVFQSGTGINFFEDGGVLTATLKGDASSNGFTFAAGGIRFFPDGRVNSGTLKSAAMAQNLALQARFGIMLDQAGRVTQVDGGGLPKYPLLGRTLRGSAGVVFDPGSNLYQLASGTVAEPQLIARLIIRDSNGQRIPVPVLMPAFSTFRLRANDQSGNWYDWWVPPAGFQLAGHNFGHTPMVLIRDMRVLGVQIKQPLTIAGRQYNAGDTVWLNDAGDPLP